MRPLPRLHAVTNADVLSMEDLGVRAAAIASLGPSVALHVRDHAAGGAQLARVTRRFLSLARPPEAAVLVNGHPDIARALGAQGVQLRATDLAPADARSVLGPGWIGCSVHSPKEAETAIREGADFLLVGQVYPSASHRETQPVGPDIIRECATLGVPVIAIGGITSERALDMKEAGAYGVAAISALWRAVDSAAAAVALLEPWLAT
jgi:thiamine-phosphate pyrophosphorylase